MNEVTKAYVAAMIDGEGVISLGRRKGTGKRNRNGREWHVTIRVIVTNSHAGLIGFLKTITGVGVTHEHKTSAREDWSPIHRWQVTANQARWLLSEIRPYLVIKADVADVILNMPMQSKGGRRPEDATIYEQQMACFECAKELNRRGVKRAADFHAFPQDHPLLTNSPRA